MSEASVATPDTVCAVSVASADVAVVVAAEGDVDGDDRRDVHLDEGERREDLRRLRCCP